MSSTVVTVTKEEALTEGIEKMLKELEKGGFDSKEIQSYAYGHFEIDQVSKRYMKLYRKCLNKK